MLQPLRARAEGAGLFPQAPCTDESPPPTRRRIIIGIQAVAVVVAAVVLLFRVTGVSAWNCVYAEDRGIFLVQALARPWHLLVPYNGYLQLLPRLLGQLVALLPLPWAAAAFAWAGALTAAACALFIYHASAGYIGSRALRGVLAASLILLPIAPLELADNGVNTPWYLMIALFWAVLWRPESLRGKVVSALIAFLVVTSSPLALVFTPLLVMRFLALPRSGKCWVRENAVTAGWLLGWPLQAYGMASSPMHRVGSLASPGAAAGYWAQTVVLRAFGWHISWDLVRVLGTTGATLLCGAVLAVLLGLAWTTGGRQVRVLVPLAIATGFVYTAGSAMITSYVVSKGQAPYLVPVSFEAASRYSSLSLILLDAALIAGADAFAARHGGLGEVSRAALHGIFPAVARCRFRALTRGPAARAAAVLAVLAVLAAVLVPGWVTDYSYLTQRTTNGPWAPAAARDLRFCQTHEAIRLREWFKPHGVVVPCSRLVR